MTKQNLITIEAWLRVLGLTLLGGVGFCLLLHDIDTDVPTMSLGWSLLARVAGSGVLYLIYRAGKTLHKWGLLPKMMYEDELED